MAQCIENALMTEWTARIHVNQPQADWLRHEERAK